MRGLFVIVGREKKEDIIKEAYHFDTVILLHVLDTSLYELMSQLEFADLIKEVEDLLDGVKLELEKSGKRVRIDSQWGPLKEKVKNAIRKWEPDKIVIFTGKASDVVKKKLGRVRGAKYI